MDLDLLLAGDDVMSFDVKPTRLHLRGSDMTLSLATEDQHHLLP